MHLSTTKNLKCDPENEFLGEMILKIDPENEFWESTCWKYDPDPEFWGESILKMQWRTWIENDPENDELNRNGNEIKMKWKWNQTKRRSCSKDRTLTGPGGRRRYPGWKRILPDCCAAWTTSGRRMPLAEDPATRPVSPASAQRTTTPPHSTPPPILFNKFNKINQICKWVAAHYSIVILNNWIVIEIIWLHEMKHMQMSWW